MLKLVSLISGLALASTFSAQVEPRAGALEDLGNYVGQCASAACAAGCRGTAAEIQWVKS